jgi:hypothetical protein
MSNPLPATFQLSSSSLQDYADCPRRFQLRFVLMQPWPALITGSPEAAERHVQRGADFHHLARQHSLGLTSEELAPFLTDPILGRWWQAFLLHPPADLPSAVRRTEFGLSTPLLGRRLVARLDLLAVDPGERAVVVDWKTPPRRPTRTLLAQRLQTRVYRYLVVKAGSVFNGGQDVRPDQVEMVYWFAGSADTERFAYDAQQFEADHAYLALLASEIGGRGPEIWPLTRNERLCQFCNYRSLCERGVRAGLLEEFDDDLEAPVLEVEFEQVAEVAF